MLIGPFVFYTTVNGENYLQMLESKFYAEAERNRKFQGIIISKIEPCLTELMMSKKALGQDLSTELLDWGLNQRMVAK